MATSAERRVELENHLKKFREIADHRLQEKITRWGYHLPALTSLIIIIFQIANTIIFGQFAYNFGQLYILLDEYMRETDLKNITLPNSTLFYRYNGVNAERINEIDLYHDQLWTLFVAEVIELIFPTINILMFSWIVKDKKRKFSSKIQIIYLLCPALALILSITQAFTIQVTLTESIYTIRFLLSKLLGVLLELNKPGRLPIENFFECEFYNDDDIVKPPCAGQLHDTVVSRSTLTVLIVIHIIPVIVFIYLLLKNLTSNKSEHLFLYIESVENPSSKQQQANELSCKKQFKDGSTPQTLKQTLNQMLTDFNIKFIPKRIFHQQLNKFHIPAGSTINNMKNSKENKSETAV